MSKLPAKPASQDVAAFLAKVKSLPSVRAAGGTGRLIFALDATASRQPMWDHACKLQGEMFGALKGQEARYVPLLLNEAAAQVLGWRLLPLARLLRPWAVASGAAAVVRSMDAWRKDALPRCEWSCCS